MSFVLKSRIPQIIANVQRNVAEVNMASARRIADDARGRAPRDRGELASGIRAAKGKGDDAGVEVSVPWRWHFPEYGTVRQAARPYLTPAAEAEREAHRKAIRDLYK
jgi:HK97 gp10 family phage protein